MSQSDTIFTLTTQCRSCCQNFCHCVPDRNSTLPRLRADLPWTAPLPPPQDIAAYYGTATQPVRSYIVEDVQVQPIVDEMAAFFRPMQLADHVRVRCRACHHSCQMADIYRLSIASQCSRRVLGNCPAHSACRTNNSSAWLHNASQPYTTCSAWLYNAGFAWPFNAYTRFYSGDFFLIEWAASHDAWTCTPTRPRL